METSLTLLERLQQPQPDPKAWQRFVDIYSPLVRCWIARSSLQASDRDDVAQEVLRIVVSKLPEFRRRRNGAFRTWLRVITANCMRTHWRSEKYRPSPGAGTDFLQLVQQLEDPTSALAQEWDAEHDRYVVRRLLELIESQFEPTTLKAFRQVVMEGQKPAQVASELGISVNAVYLGRSRILRRLRHELEGILSDEISDGQVSAG